MVNISETVRDRYIVTMEYYMCKHTPLNGAISNDLE